MLRQHKQQPLCRLGGGQVPEHGEHLPRLHLPVSGMELGAMDLTEEREKDFLGPGILATGYSLVARISASDLPFMSALAVAAFTGWVSWV